MGLVAVGRVSAAIARMAIMSISAMLLRRCKIILRVLSCTFLCNDVDRVCLMVFFCNDVDRLLLVDCFCIDGERLCHVT